MIRVIGVDPGINGAIAAYDGESLAVQDMPKSKSKGRGFELNFALLTDIVDLMFDSADHAFIENVSVRPNEGRGSGFKFGYAAGGIRGLLAGKKMPITMVAPNSWKPKMGLNNDKEYARTRACEVFPRFADSFKLKKDHNKAEAALLAYYGYLQLTRK